MALVEYELRGRVGFITLNRPERLNALNDAMMAELDDLLRRIETDLGPKVLVLRGAGGNFSSGADLKELEGSQLITLPGSDLPVKQALELERRRHRRLEYIFNYPKPIIAQVEGYCLGLGFYLAMVCDLVFAAEDAVLGDPSLRMGLLPALPLLGWLVGQKKAKELVYLGGQISGREAERLGLINKALPRSALEAEVHRYARAISICPGDGLALMKEDINAMLESRGIGAAWRFLDEMQVLGTVGRETPGFFRLLKEEGLKKAVAERDRPFKELGF